MTIQPSLKSIVRKHDAMINFKNQSEEDLINQHKLFLNEIGKFRVMRDDGTPNVSEQLMSDIVSVWGKIISTTEKEVGAYQAINLAILAFNKRIYIDEDNSPFLSKCFRSYVASTMLDLSPKCLKETPDRVKRIVVSLCDIHDSNIHDMLCSTAGVVAVKIIESCAKGDFTTQYRGAANDILIAVKERSPVISNVLKEISGEFTCKDSVSDKSSKRLSKKDLIPALMTIVNG